MVALNKQGDHVNHKTVQQLMAEQSLNTLTRVKKYRSWEGKNSKIAPNILQWSFKAKRPNEKWVTNVTEFAVGGQKLYLSPVINLFNSEIISQNYTNGLPMPVLIFNTNSPAQLLLKTRR